MATVSQVLDKIHQRAVLFSKREAQEKDRKKKFFWKSLKWLTLLAHEFVKDDVKVRAQSLSFLMIFSILPLIAGVFFVFTIFTQFGMVQEALTDMIQKILDTIPEENHAFVMEYVTGFKDAYLASIQGKSGRLGIFALGFLMWVGIQTLNTIEQTLNHIWASEYKRSFMERVRNFIVVAVGAPWVITASLSIPLILRKIPVTQQLLETIPFLGTFLNYIIPLGLVVLMFVCLYRYVPTRLVSWRAALAGAVTSSVLLQIANIGMNIYFRFGTNTAYGKAAVIPLICFWIYVVWVVVIIGAEVSYLVQNKNTVLQTRRDSPSLFEAECLLNLMHYLDRVFRDGSGPVSLDRMCDATGVDSQGLRKIIDYLESEKIIALCAEKDEQLDMEFTLLKDISRDSLATHVKKFMIEGSPRSKKGELTAAFEKGIDAWLSSYKSVTFKS